MLPILQLTPAQRAGLYRLLSAVICLALILGVPGAGFAAPEEKNDAAPLTITDPHGFESRNAIVHLFEWKWTDIAKECKFVLGPKGYKAVQISPPNEHAIVKNEPLYYANGEPTGQTYNYPWWQRYQPVSHQVTEGLFVSRSGNYTDFVTMIDTCHAEGVDVYVDAVINHMANDKGLDYSDGGGAYGFGSAGTKYYHYNYVNDYGNMSDFHNGWYSYCPDWDIPGGAYGNSDWGVDAVRQCELDNLADLEQDQDYVQTHLAAYLNGLLALKVDGFRIDAAKHMYPGDPANPDDTNDLFDILNRLNNTWDGDEPYIYQEVIESQGEPISGDLYQDTGDVTEFQYSKEIDRVFDEGSLAWLENFNASWSCDGTWTNCMMVSDKAQVFVQNHDNQRGHGGSYIDITYKQGDVYQLENIFMLAWPYGMPTVMSSYEFDIVGTDNVKYDGLGPPSSADGTTQNIYLNSNPDDSSNRCATGPGEYYDGADNRNGWVCEHSWPAIANMAAFRAETMAADGSGTVNNWYDNGNDLIAFGVNNKGFVIINKESSVLSNTTLSTGLPDGTYCNVILGELNAHKTGCTGETITVTNGAASFTVPANSAVAIHVGQKVAVPLPTPPTVSSISPVKATYGITSLPLTVTGSGFTQNTNIMWNGAPLSTTYVNSTTLQVTLTSANLGTSAANIPVSVSDPEDGAATSSFTFQVIAPATFSGLDDKALDGQILESGKDKNTGGTTTATGTTINIGDDAQKRELRGIFSFNTAATLPDNATVVRAELKLYCTAKTSTMNLTPMHVDGSMAFNNNTTLEAVDWQAAPTYSKIASLSTFTASQWHTFNLAQFGSINLSNTSQRTQFRLYFPASDNDTKADTVTFASGDNGTSSNRPQLTVYYYVP
ncbi:MAG: alpha amylase C-terminal domain-containing protein [Chloroflexi bacterium]|nr:alpha amylase C-terminal domain-containing protein [Chloroflexota bacterium]